MLFRSDPVEGAKDEALFYSRHLELCELDGCTAEECGIPAGVCNGTSMQCYKSFSQCTSTTIDDLRFISSAMYTSASEVGIDVSVSDDGLTVTWPRDMGVGVTGAAMTADGSTSSGKWYFEARISGKCAMVGVANQAFRPHDRAGGANSWMWSDAGSGGVMFHESGTFFVPQISMGSTIGVAFDSATGQIWFSKDGSDQWMTRTSLFTSSPQEEAAIASGYAQLRPVIGVAADCTSPVPVSISARFRAVDFQYRPPVGFTSMVQDDCACTEALSLCLEESNCMTHEMRETLYRQCEDNGCSKEQCGVAPGIQSPFCLKHESEQCANDHHKCLEAAEGQGTQECACTKQLLECYQDHSCEKIGRAHV